MLSVDIYAPVLRDCTWKHYGGMVYDIKWWGANNTWLFTMVLIICEVWAFVWPLAITEMDRVM